MTADSIDTEFSHRKFSIAEAAAHLRVSRGFVFKLLKQGKIKGSKLGRRTLITGRDIERALNESAH